MRTKLYIAKLDRLYDGEVFAQSFATLPEYRQRKILALANINAKVQSMGVWLLLCKALADVGITEIGEISLGEYGKPSLKNAPFFSLAHTDKAAVCAVSDSDVGVDCERIKKPDMRVAKRFFTESELAYVNGGDVPERFFAVWTAKESYVKANGMGLSMPLASFSVFDVSGYVITPYRTQDLLVSVCSRDVPEKEPEFVIL